MCLTPAVGAAFDLGKAMEQAMEQGMDMLGGESGGDAAMAALSDSEVADGLKEALAQGVETAIKSLGQTDGFLGNELVRIAMPDQVQSVAKMAASSVPAAMSTVSRPP